MKVLPARARLAFNLALGLGLVLPHPVAGAEVDGPHPPGNALFSEARSHRDNGRLDEAIHAYEALLTSDPRSWLGRYELAQVLMTLKRFETAEAQLQSAILIEPAQSALWARLGQVYLLMSDYPKAELSLVRARQLDPSDAGVRYNLGRLLEKQGRFEEALDESLAFLQLSPGDSREAPLRRRIALLYENTSRPDLAIGQYRALVAMNPKSADAHQGLADLLYKQMVYDEAYSEYHNVLNLDPKNAAAYFNIGFIRKFKGDLDGAESAFRSGLAISPDSPKTLYNLGTVRFEKGDFQGAAELFEQVILSEPEHRQVHYIYSRALAKLGRPDEARRELATHHEITERLKVDRRTPATMSDD